MPRFRNTILVLSLSICSSLFLESCNSAPPTTQQDNSPSNLPIVDSVTNTSERNTYYEIDLEQLPADSKKGSNPQEIALTAFGTEETEGFVEENVEVDTKNSEEAIVIITQKNLPDDSVNSIRYRVDFIKDNSQWQMEWAGQQFICQPGRGNQDWSKEFCF